MTDVNETAGTANESNPEADKPVSDNRQERHGDKCHPCGPRGWQGRHGKRKMVASVFLLVLLAFFAGRGCSHPHEHWRMGYGGQPTVTQSFKGAEQQMPLSTMLDGIAATPEQRAKAVDLLR